jgi:hypothetical protein
MDIEVGAILGVDIFYAAAIKKLIHFANAMR